MKPFARKMMQRLAVCAKLFKVLGRVFKALDPIDHVAIAALILMAVGVAGVAGYEWALIIVASIMLAFVFLGMLGGRNGPNQPNDGF